MALGKKDLLNKTRILELEGLQNIKFTPACMSALEALLYDVYHVQSPRPSDYDHRKELVRVFNLMAREIYGNHGEFPVVQPFGSFLMDMFSAESDLDLSINFSNDMVEFPREKKIQTLRMFSRRLYSFQSKGHVSSVQPIFRARVPILKVVDHGTGVECDISVENKDGILKSQIIHIIAAIDERFQKLSCLMKAWAKAHDINSSKDHTLNSLSIILLVAFHLQNRNPPILPAFRDLFKHGTDPEWVKKLVHGFLRYGERNKESLAELFLTLLTKVMFFPSRQMILEWKTKTERMMQQFTFAQKWNHYYLMLVSVETLWPEGLCASTYEGCWISKTWDPQVGYINVEDFTDRSENVARSVGKEGAEKIYKCIRTSLHDLSAFMNGRIQAPNLEGLFFGPKHYSTLKSGATVNLKRSFPFSDPVMLPTPVNPIPTKKRQFREVSVGELKPHGWIPCDVASQSQPIHNQHPPVVAQEHGYRSELVPSGFVQSGGPSHIASVPPLYGGGLQKNMNPMLNNEPPYVRHAQEYAYRSVQMPSGSVWSGGTSHSISVPPPYGGLQLSPRSEGFAKYKSQ